MGDELFQQEELAGREAHLPPAERHFTAHHVDADAAGPEQGVRGPCPGPQVGPDPGYQLGEGERLAQVVVRAQVEPLDLVVHAPSGAEHQHRNRGPACAQAFEHVEAVQVGQAEIEDDERDAGPFGPPQRVPAAARPLDVIAVPAEPFLEERSDAFLVLNDQQRHRGILIQKAAPRPGRVDHAAFSVVGPGDSPHDRQSQPRAALRRRPGAERLEDNLLIAGRQPASFVGDLETPAGGRGLNAEPDRILSPGMLGRVLQQVHEGLGEPLRVGPEHGARGGGLRPDPVPQDRLRFRGDAGHEAVQGQRLPPEQRPVVHPGERGEVFHHPAHEVQLVDHSSLTLRSSP